MTRHDQGAPPQSTLHGDLRVRVRQDGAQHVRMRPKPKTTSCGTGRQHIGLGSLRRNARDARRADSPPPGLTNRCKGCDKAIGEGHIRFGSISDPDKSAHGHGQAYWKHYECLTAKQMINIDEQGGITAVDGFSDLKAADRTALEKKAKALRSETEAKEKAKADEQAAKEERKRERARNAELKRQQKAEAKAAREEAKAEAKAAKQLQKKRKAEEME